MARFFWYRAVILCLLLSQFSILAKFPLPNEEISCIKCSSKLVGGIAVLTLLSAGVQDKHGLEVLLDGLTTLFMLIVVS